MYRVELYAQEVSLSKGSVSARPPNGLAWREGRCARCCATPLRRAIGGANQRRGRSWIPSPESSIRSSSTSGTSEETTPHRKTHLRPLARRVRFHRRLHDRQGLCSRQEARRARDVRAAGASAGRCPDFGEALVVIDGVQRKAHYLVVDLPHSDDAFVKAFPAERRKRFARGTTQRFGTSAACHAILYDNTTLAVARILGDGRRKRTRVFSELQSHYLFSDRFGRPGKGNDKGKVEGLVGYARRNFMVPAPRFPSWEAFNEQLEAQCLNNRKRRLRRHTAIEERFKRGQALLPLPPTPYDACDKRTTRVTSLSLVRYRANDYSARHLRGLCAAATIHHQRVAHTSNSGHSSMTGARRRAESAYGQLPRRAGR